MYRIDTSSNKLIALESRRFSELGFSERAHLQEWIANCPNCLGEDLLIIQKEFDGFDETRERLDLLALDKQGSLVIIENKLDDSGRDVVWQALKYASYCSSLKATQIVDIYQAYLDKHSRGDSAKELICEFLDTEDLADVKLNVGIDQRLILVSANFRREATSTVMWLLQHGIRAKCFKATPFRNGSELFLNVEQIIPTPEAADFMIGISEKEKEQQTTERIMANRHTLRLDFWQATLGAFEQKNIPLFRNVSASQNHWLNTGSGVSGIPYTMIFSRSEARVQIDIQRASKEENKRLFDLLLQEREAIQGSFGHALEWERLDEKNASKIIYRKAFDGYNRESWPEMIEWLIEHIQLLERAFKPRLQKAIQKLKSSI